MTATVHNLDQARRKRVAQAFHAECGRMLWLAILARERHDEATADNSMQDMRECLAEYDALLRQREKT